VIVTVINQKGGVGKTTTSVNLSYLFSKKRKTALIDLDPEGGSTVSFGIRREQNEIKLGSKSVNIFNVEVYPASIGLLKLELGGDINEITKDIKRIAETVDSVVIDTPPNLGKLAVSAMIVADKIVSPVTPQPLSIEAVKNLDSRLSSLKKGAISFTNFSTKPITVDGLSSVKFAGVGIPQSRIFIEASRLGVPALRYEEVRSRKGRLYTFFEALEKAIIQ
jgi:chromosome partitioning protein